MVVVDRVRGIESDFEFDALAREPARVCSDRVLASRANKPGVFIAPVPDRPLGCEVNGLDSLY